MTTPEPGRCPYCAGPQMAGHPGGPLEIQHDVHCPILAAEDATRAADYDRSGERGRSSYDRPATAAETLLISALSLPVPNQGITVTHLTPGVRGRHWPELDDERPAP